MVPWRVLATGLLAAIGIACFYVSVGSDSVSGDEGAQPASGDKGAPPASGEGAGRVVSVSGPPLASLPCQAVPPDPQLVVEEEGDCRVDVLPASHLERQSYKQMQATGQELKRTLRKEAIELALGRQKRQLKYTFVRHLTEWGSQIDLLINSYTDQPNVPLFGEGRPKQFDWYWSAAKINGCNGCGYSCNLFGFMYYEDKSLSQPVLPYPLHLPPAKIFVPGGKRDPKYNKAMGSKKCLVRCGYFMHGHSSDGGKYNKRPVMEFYEGSSLGAMLTARRLGYHIRNMSKHEFPQQRCGQLITKRAIVFGKLEWPDLTRDNFAHWFHDMFFPLFMKIMQVVGIEGMPTSQGTLKGDGYVVVVPEQDFQKALKGGMSWLLEILAPNRTEPHPGLCLEQAYFDCPATATMKPTFQLQQWLAGVGWSYAPLPVPARPLLVMMLRLPGGSRFIGNWQELERVAIEEGWDVKVPLDPRKKMVANNATTLREEIIPAYRNAHCVMGFHGSELALMPLMRNRSVVIEICPRDYRYLDNWYVEQAEAQGLRLLRWAPNNDTATYGSKFDKFDHYSPGWWRARQSEWNFTIPEFRVILKSARRLLTHPDRRCESGDAKCSEGK
eukprot:Hpha_TRINITY_DN881_c0_g2::TRINITY_DN881_c0_g2_i1::g.195013::m.195013